MDTEVPEEKDGNVPNDAVQDGPIPHDAERDRTVPHDAVRDGTVRNSADELHTTTIREALKLFEDAGVPRAERTLVKWCGKDATGTGRLDCQLDQNEGRYYITEESIERAIAEEQAKNRGQEPLSAPEAGEKAVEEPEEKKELELQIRDLEISNRAKDQYIEKLEQGHEQVLGQLVEASRQVGQLETKLQALEAPRAGDGDYSNP